MQVLHGETGVVKFLLYELDSDGVKFNYSSQDMRWYGRDNALLILLLDIFEVLPACVRWFDLHYVPLLIIHPC